MRRLHSTFVVLFSISAVYVVLLAGCATAQAPAPTTTSTLEPKPPVSATTDTAKKLKPKDKLDFVMKHNLKKDGTPNGETFAEDTKWEVSEFIGSGDVWMEEGGAIIGEGNDMTGISWKGPLPKTNYEVTLEAKRVGGEDFFCALTFPYGEDPCSLVVGGWGGRLVGISSLDWMDASENGTATWRDFELNKWYSIRLRITPEKIEAWIDGEQLVDVETKGKEIGIRFEVNPSKPFGIATWRTTGAVRNMKLRAFEAGKQ